MHPFQRGVVLPFRKGEAPTRPIEDLPVTRPLRIPLLSMSSDLVAPPAITLKKDTACAAGEMLYDSGDGLPSIAPVAGTPDGTIVIRHPQYGGLLCAQFTPSDETQTELLPILPDNELTTEKILQIAHDAAIYDELDGVPLCDKLASWQMPARDAAAMGCTLVADATENDVFGSAAWAVLEENPRLVLDGLRLAARALHFSRYHIATMLPKDKRRKVRQAVGRINLYIVGDEYPVTTFSGRHGEVFRIGVQACLALVKAVRNGEKARSAVITVAGDGVPRSRNLRVPYGTDISDILTYCQAHIGTTVTLGDAMNGVPCSDLHMPLLPGTTTLLVQRVRHVRHAQPCIGCGRCAAVCHAELLPYEICRRLENMHYERLQHLFPWECDGCAACSYVCPAGRDVCATVLQAGETQGSMFLNWGDDNNE